VYFTSAILIRSGWQGAIWIKQLPRTLRPPKEDIAVLVTAIYWQIKELLSSKTLSQYSSACIWI
jgi:hypothetical protein